MNAPQHEPKFTFPFPEGIGRLTEIGPFRRRWLSYLPLGKRPRTADLEAGSLADFAELELMWVPLGDGTKRLARAMVPTYCVRDLGCGSHELILCRVRLDLPPTPYTVHTLLLVDEGPVEGTPYLANVRMEADGRVFDYRMIWDHDPKRHAPFGRQVMRRHSPRSALKLTRPITGTIAQVSSQGPDAAEVNVAALVALQFQYL